MEEEYLWLSRNSSCFAGAFILDSGADWDDTPLSTGGLVNAIADRGGFIDTWDMMICFGEMGFVMRGRRLLCLLRISFCFEISCCLTNRSCCSRWNVIVSKDDDLNLYLFILSRLPFISRVVRAGNVSLWRAAPVLLSSLLASRGLPSAWPSSGWAEPLLLLFSSKDDIVAEVRGTKMRLCCKYGVAGCLANNLRQDWYSFNGNVVSMNTLLTRWGRSPR